MTTIVVMIKRPDGEIAATALPTWEDAEKFVHGLGLMRSPCPEELDDDNNVVCRNYKHPTNKIHAVAAEFDQ